MTKESIILAALKLDEYERKQIALVLLGTMLNEPAANEAMQIVKQENHWQLSLRGQS